MNTEVKWTKRFEKQLKRLPDPILRKIQFWVRMVEKFGLIDVRKQPGFHDEPLKGKWKGFRSVRINKAYRLIYRELNKHIVVELMEINKYEY